MHVLNSFEQHRKRAHLNFNRWSGKKNQMITLKREHHMCLLKEKPTKKEQNEAVATAV